MEGGCKSVGGVRDPPLLLGIDQVDGMAFVAGLGPGMGLVALVAGPHGRAVGSGSPFVMGQISVAVDAQHLLVGVLFVGYFDHPDLVQVHLFPARDVWMAARASLAHQVIAGRKTVGKGSASSRDVAVHTVHRSRMHPGGKPSFGNILVFVTGQAEERVAGGKPDDAEGRNRCQD